MTRLIPLVAVLALFGCGKSETKKVAEPAVASNVGVNDTRPVYNVYFDADGFAPFVMSDADNRPSGFGIDFVTAIGEKQGFRPNFIPHPFSGMLESVGKGADMAVAAITVTDERKALVDFTNTHFETSQAVLVPEGSSIASLNDLKGKKVAIVDNTVGADIVLQLQAGNGSITHNTSVSYYANNYKSKKLRVLTDPSLPKEHYALAVAKNKPELLKKLNTGLEQIKADGTYDKIYQKWFQSSVTTQAVPASDAK